MLLSTKIKKPLILKIRGFFGLSPIRLILRYNTQLFDYLNYKSVR